MRIVAAARLPDHHRYSAADLRRGCSERGRGPGARPVTTPKDAARLPPDHARTRVQVVGVRAGLGTTGRARRAAAEALAMSVLRPDSGGSARCARAAAAGLRRCGPARASGLGAPGRAQLGPLLPVSPRGRHQSAPGDAGTRRRRPAAHHRAACGTISAAPCAELPQCLRCSRTAVRAGLGDGRARHRWRIAAPGRPGDPVLRPYRQLGDAAGGGRRARHRRSPMSTAPPTNPLIADHRRRAAARSRRRRRPHVPEGREGRPRRAGPSAGGGRLGMLMDQKMNDGIAAEFFGHRP